MGSLDNPATNFDPRQTNQVTAIDPTTGAPDVEVNPDGVSVHSTISSAYQTGTKILDPAQRQAYMSALAAKLSGIATPLVASAGEALDKNDPEAAADAMNALGRMIGSGASMQYKVEKGKVVHEGSGKELRREELLGALYAVQREPEKALAAALAGEKGAEDAAFKAAELADKQKGTRQLGEHYKQQDETAAKYYASVADENAAQTLATIWPAAAANGRALGWTDQQTVSEMNQAAEDYNKREPVLASFFSKEDLPSDLNRGIGAMATMLYADNLGHASRDGAYGASQYIAGMIEDYQSHSIDQGKFKEWAGKNGISFGTKATPGVVSVIVNGETLTLAPGITDTLNRLKGLGPYAKDPNAVVAPPDAPRTAIPNVGNPDPRSGLNATPGHPAALPGVFRSGPKRWPD